MQESGNAADAAVKGSSGTAMELLKLAALDEDDLRIISAHMQDAHFRLGDITWLREKGRFVLVGNRYEWLSHLRGDHDVPMQARTGLHFDHVRAVKARNVRQEAKDCVLSLLAIAFHPAEEPPGGYIDLIFSGDACIRLEVECIEAWMEDLGECWCVEAMPCHEDER